MFSQSESRRYDLEQESKKLYGHDIKSLLEKFRRTPDYIKILEEEMESIGKHLQINLAQNANYFSRKLKAKISEVVEGNHTEKAKSRLRTGGVTYTTYEGPHRKPIVRQHTHNMSGVERLEQYSKLHPLLTLQDRNHMMDLGFEYCGYAIHGVIKSIDPSIKTLSTLNPFAGEPEKTTLYHEHNHQVSPDNSTVTEPESLATDPTMYRNRNSRVKHKIKN